MPYRTTLRCAGIAIVGQSGGNLALLQRCGEQFVQTHLRLVS